MKETKLAFKWIVGVLKKHRIPFEISGGLAARAYGARRPLADIDININEKNYKKMMKEVSSYLKFGPGVYKDKHWNLKLMTLCYKGQYIDIAGVTHAKIFNSINKKWVMLRNHPARASMKKVYGISVPVENKKELIAYKKKLLRKVDGEDLKDIC